MAGSAIDRVDSEAAIPTIVAQETLQALQRYSTMMSLVSRDWDNEIASYGEAVKIIEAGAVTVQDKTPETPLTYTANSPNNYTVTLNHHKVATVMIEDTAKALSRPDLLAAYGEKAAIALAEAVDDTILALVNDASVTQEVGTAGTALTQATVLDARTKLNGAKAPKADRAIILSSDAEGEFFKAIAGQYVTPFNNPAMQSGDIPSLYGFMPYVDQGVPIVAGTPNKICNLAFQKQGLVLASRPLPAPPAGVGVASSVINLDNVGMRVLSSYDHDNLSLKVTMDLLFGVLVLRPTFVVRVAA